MKQLVFQIDFLNKLINKIKSKLMLNLYRWFVQIGVFVKRAGEFIVHDIGWSNSFSEM